MATQVISSGGESAGMKALDTLFTPTAKPTAAPAKASSSLTDPPPKHTELTESEFAGDAQAEPADLGSLGDVPGDTPTAQATETEQAASAKAEANPFSFSVTDDKGRRKVSVDLNDKEALARILPQAYGFRKMQAERDQHAAKLKDIEPKLADLESNWKTLETAYQQSGVEGVIDLLGGKKGHYKEFLQTEIQRDARYKTATEAERKLMDQEAEIAKLRKDSETRDKAAQEAAKAAATAKEQADLTNLEAQMVPVFNKYRFAGTLGDAGQEAAFDKAVWKQALDELIALPDEQALTAQLVDTTFRRVSTSFKAAIGKSASAQARASIAKTKDAAQTRVAAAANRALQPATDMTAQMTAGIRKGGIGGLTDGLMSILRNSK